MGLLEGKVIVITGAGGGLGRAYALAMAAEGGKIVVNDLGGARDGSGGGASMADTVVAEIRAAGGEAVANYDSVATMEGGAAIVQSAVDAFGRLDVLVNNAGILRDKTLMKMDEAMWDLVIAVHLKGTFAVTQPAVAQMRAQGGGGKVINTSSYAGLVGNIGQSNYGAAKAGIAGFTRVLALELGRYGIQVNAIAPMAKTRMTEDIAMVPDTVTPEQIAPMAVFLASSLSDGVNGRIFGAHGPEVFEYKQVMTPMVVKRDGVWTAQEIAARLDEIGRQPTFAAGGATGGPGGAAEKAGGQSDEAALVDTIFARMPDGFRADKAEGWNTLIHFEVTGVGDYTLVVEKGTCRTQKGKEGTPKCTITFAGADVIAGMVAGKLKPEQAFMAGKIKADNMGELMKFGQSFDLRKGAAKAGGAGTAGDGAPAAGPTAEKATGLNRACLGRRYDAGAVFATPETIAAYARATNDENPRYLDEGIAGGVMASPLYPVKPLMDAVALLIADKELNVDVLRLVHGEQDMVFHRPIRPWDLLTARARVAAIEDKSSGQLLQCRQQLWSDGALVCEVTSGYFIRGPKKPEAGSAPAGGEGAKAAAKPIAAPTAATEAERALVFEAQETVARDQSVRYAAASGDSNPIHTDPAIAKAAGHPDVILHGLCTMAFAQKAVVDNFLGGNPTRLRRLKVRFSRIVLPGEVLTTRAWIIEESAGVTRLGIEMVNQDGKPVLSNAEAEVVG
jgi:NAD(P)-dependent dehydrogenase (short-subunit alcohol dehydrogenase family)/acyl dehydratase/putative sterol carrier protein